MPGNYRSDPVLSKAKACCVKGNGGPLFSANEIPRRPMIDLLSDAVDLEANPSESTLRRKEDVDVTAGLLTAEIDCTGARG